ncbi:MAG: glycosyltransferase family 2 protein [Thomasclavelia sp.]
MEEDKVSIIVPVYNVEKFLGKCLESIITQTYQNIEIVVINDGSTDNSLAICQEYEKKDSRIYLINSMNEGVSSARNKGIKKATGKYLAFVDSDDYIEKNMIETLVKRQKETNAELVICDLFFENIYGNCITQKNNFNINYVLLKDTAISVLSIKKGFYGFLVNKLFIRDIIIKNSIMLNPKIRFREDLLFCIEYIRYINFSSYVKNKFYHYVNHENATTSEKNITNAKKIENRINSLEANYLIMIAAKKYNDRTILNKAKNLFYVNYGETLDAISDKQISLKYMAKYSFKYFDFFKSLLDMKIPLYLKIIAIKGVIKNI